MGTDLVEILSAEQIRRTINRLASETIEKSGELSQLVFLGIYTRGVPLARLLAKQVCIQEGLQVPVGALDITFYRDDLHTHSMLTQLKLIFPSI